MPRFTKKPVTIEAIQFTGDNLFDVLRFMRRPESEVNNLELKATDCPIIHTLEGEMRTSPGDWVIRGVKGEYYPCKPDVFEATYDRCFCTTSDGGDFTCTSCLEKRESKVSDAVITGDRDLARRIAIDCALAHRGDHSYISDDFEPHEWVVDAVARALLPPLVTIKADMPPEQFAEFKKKWMETTSTHRAVMLDGERTGMNKPEPPPQRRDDLRPCWETVVEEFIQTFTTEDGVTKADVINDVVDDMKARDKAGRVKYDTPLTAFNGRDQLIDAYQEALDLAVYLRAAQDEGITGVSAIYSNTLHNIFWLRVAINGRVKASA